MLVRKLFRQFWLTLSQLQLMQLKMNKQFHGYKIIYAIQIIFHGPRLIVFSIDNID